MAQYAVELDRYKQQGGKVSSTFGGGGLRNPQLQTLEDNAVYQLTNFDVVKQEIAGSFKMVNGKKVPATWEFLLATNTANGKLAQFGPGHVTRSLQEVSIQEVVDEDGNTSEEIVPGDMKFSDGGVVDLLVAHFSTQQDAMYYLYEAAQHGYFFHVKINRILTFKFGSRTETKEGSVYTLSWYKDGKIITDPTKFPPLTWEEAPADAEA